MNTFELELVLKNIEAHVKNFDFKTIRKKCSKPITNTADRAFGLMWCKNSTSRIYFIQRYQEPITYITCCEECNNSIVNKYLTDKNIQGVKLVLRLCI